MPYLDFGVVQEYSTIQSTRVTIHKNHSDRTIGWANKALKFMNHAKIIFSGAIIQNKLALKISLNSVSSMYVIIAIFQQHENCCVLVAITLVVLVQFKQFCDFLKAQKNSTR